MAISSFYDYKTKVLDGGQTHSFYYRKAAPITSGGVAWLDTSMLVGMPTPNYYAEAPLNASLVDTIKGFQIGPTVTDTKYLKQFSLCVNGVAGAYSAILADYLLFYPFIDGDDTGVQTMVNSTSLPSRGNLGEGVQMMLVAQGSYIGGGTLAITYTNSQGATRSTLQVPVGVAATTATIATAGSVSQTNGTCFIPLAVGDRGVRAVQSLQFSTPVGGVFALVLVKPLGTVGVHEANGAQEKDFLVSGAMPVIYNDSILNIIMGATVATNPAQVFYGRVQTVWG